MPRIVIFCQAVLPNFVTFPAKPYDGPQANTNPKNDFSLYFRYLSVKSQQMARDPYTGTGIAFLLHVELSVA